MQMLTRVFTGLLLGVFVQTQCYAVEQSAAMTLRLADLSMEVDNPENAAELSRQTEAGIDAHLADIQAEDQEVNAEIAAEDESEFATVAPANRYERIKARWVRRLAERQPMLVERFNASIDQKSDAELTTAFASVAEFSQKGSVAVDPIELRAAAKKGFADKLSENFATLPDRIAAAGGAFAFALKSKRDLQEAREGLAVTSHPPRALCYILSAVGLGIAVWGTWSTVAAVAAATATVMTWIMAPFFILIFLLAGVGMVALGCAERSTGDDSQNFR